MRSTVAMRVKSRAVLTLCACALSTTLSQAADGDTDTISRVFNRPSSWIELASHQCVPGDGCADACVPGVGGAGSGCCDNICARPTLTGGLFGLQPCLAQKGIMYDAQVTQFYQGVTRGGAARNEEYGGKFDQFLILDSGKMGLWQGGQMIMHAETRFGDDVLLDAAGMAPVNANMLYPTLDNETAITGLLFQQALSEEWAVSLGKFNTLDLLYMMYPQTGRGIDGFMNASMFVPLTGARTLPLSFLGAGVLKMNQGQLQGAAMVYDSNNIPTTSGFDTLFDNGVNFLGMWRFFTECGGRPGSHAFLAQGATGDYTSLDPTGWDFIPGVGIVPAQSTASWAFHYVLEQKLWVDRRTPERNVGLLSWWGYADRETSQYEWIMNVALQAQGIVPGRDMDTMGVGYFYSGLSPDFERLVSPIVRMDDLQGVELYYNAAITPWFRLTGDVQVVEPGVQANDTAVVLGLRAWLHL